ncbi:hypothetical protein K490DRAFT_52858 [Saccharata proteae CBS 121410]|uniref:Fe2OG dioxygenase domain-containing protein n=1 Tax=Saccharata proteae CBS 121410 TaxID=1314787 RepID=A0A9P4I395_9PEZI|nr:hypothetical protein K490DRAFT_52858 [Saccharata proteae CBS 121410]
MSSLLDLLTQKQPQFQTRQALVLVGLQHDFIAPSGKLPVDKPAGFVDRIKTLIPVFRQSAGEILWIRTAFDPARPVNAALSGDNVITHVDDSAESSSDDEDDDPSASAPLAAASPLKSTSSANSRPLGALNRISVRRPTEPRARPPSREQQDELFLSGRSDESPCLQGTRGAEFADEISSTIDTSADIIVTKSRYSAFNGSTLLQTLRAKLITELYICGCISNISVYATALDAARHGLTIYLVDDCIGYRHVERHQEALKQMTELMGAQTVTSKDLIQQLGGQAEQEDEMTTDSTKEDAGLDDMLKGLDIRESKRNRQVQSNAKGTLSRHASTEETRARAQGSNIGPHFLNGSPVARDRNEPALPANRSPEADQGPPRSGSVKSKIRMRKRPDSKKTPSSSSRGQAAQVSGSVKTSSTPSNPDSPTPDVQGQLLRDSSDSKVSSTISSAPLTVMDAPKPKSTTKTGENMPTATAASPLLGPGDPIGEGDSRIVHQLIPPTLYHPRGSKLLLRDQIFHLLYNEVKWQKMFHAAGEVPRLVAVQGLLGKDGSTPVYRHPSDQSLPMLRFSPAVQIVRDQVQTLVRHPVNHVLIQLYRSGQDYISEHSDKTLDIVHGSSIVNVSFGAQRTMRLRTKRSALPEPSPDQTGSIRNTERVHLPHNSMFVVGQETNMRWLHGINPDKRPASVRSDAENAFSGMRISLTFRQIGTFLSPDGSKIWGQGATSKSAASAKDTINNNAKETENIIRAFSKENQATEFDWKATYGAGFDVLHFREGPKDLPVLYMNHDTVGRKVVEIYLNELATEHRIVEPPALDEAHERDRIICFRDNDAKHTEVTSPAIILAYLDKYYKPRVEYDAVDEREATAAAYHMLFNAEVLTRQWSARSGSGASTSEAFISTLEELEEVLSTSDAHCLADGKKEPRTFIAGESFSVADAAMWPVLDEIVRTWPLWVARKYPCLDRFWVSLGRKKGWLKKEE